MLKSPRTMQTGLIVMFTVATSLVMGQSLTLDECLARSEQNYPLVKQRELIALSKEYSIQNLSRGYLPQFTVNGQATYQSDVTQVPIHLPGLDIPTLSKDQYKFYAEVSQSVFDGGLIRQQKLQQEVRAIADKQSLEVELYTLRARVYQLYFGILLSDQQLRQADLLKGDISIGLRKTEAALANGTAFKSSVDVLKADLLKADQRATEIRAIRTAYSDMLGLFINQEVDDRVVFEIPPAITTVTDIARPELQLFDFQKQNMEVQRKLIAARNLPKVNLFLQAGYGRPALNLLSNSFQTYYLGGIRFTWLLSGFYTRGKDFALIDINRKTVDVQRETFLFNTQVTVRQQNADVTKYAVLLAADDEIVSLRQAVKKSASAQLENGVINANDYLREVNAEDQARQNKIVHEIQGLMTQYTRQATLGN